VQPFANNPWWCFFAAMPPALLATILIFMDQQITAVIVNRKENKLRVSDTAALRSAIIDSIHCDTHVTVTFYFYLLLLRLSARACGK